MHEDVAIAKDAQRAAEQLATARLDDMDTTEEEHEKEVARLQGELREAKGREEASRCVGDLERSVGVQLGLTRGGSNRPSPERSKRNERAAARLEAPSPRLRDAAAWQRPGQRGGGAGTIR